MKKSLRWRRKHSLEIIYELLDLITVPTPINKIVSRLGINHRDLVKYLKILEDSNVITDNKVGRSRIIARTEKAALILNCFREIQVLLDFNPMVVK